MAGPAPNPVDYASLIKGQTRSIDIDAFKERGLKKVNVINAKKINELISQAVTNIIGKLESGGNIQAIKEDKQVIVQESMDEFKRLFAETKKNEERENKLAEEMAAMREAMSTRESSQTTTGLTNTAAITDAIAELKAFLMNQASKAQGEQMSRQVMMEQQQEFLNSKFNELRTTVQTSATAQSSSAKVGDETTKAIREVANEIKAMIEAQSKRDQADAAIRKAVREQNDLLNDKFGELREALVGTATSENEAAEAGHLAARSLRQVMAEVYDLLQEERKHRSNGAFDPLLNAIKGLGADLGMKFDGLKTALADVVGKSKANDQEVIKNGLAALREDIKHANTESLKAEITALREDLAQKTVAASAANSDAVNAQLAAMTKLIEEKSFSAPAQGANPDMMAAMQAMQDKMVNQLADAGLMKRIVSAEEAVNVGNIMVNSAFKDMDNVESNLGNMDAAKTTDKEGGAKAKKGLDMLKKLKGKG
ncbi:MAG: hypothetical protein IT462_17540 [Planctomycetes bacterium]|nr:hypothetical protein [Planctomycetota bacterium]